MSTADQLDTETQNLLRTMTADEREAYLEGLQDTDMQEAIVEADSMSEDEMKRALSGKDDPDEKKGDDEKAKQDETAESKKAEDAGGKPEAEAARSDAATGKAQPAAEEAPQTEDKPEPFRPVLRAQVPEQAEEIKRKIEAAQDDLEKKYREGEIDFDEYRAQDRKFNAQLQHIRDAELQARIYADQQAQTAQQEWLWNVKQFMKQAKKSDGIDYESDTKLHKDLDLMVKALASDPDNAEKGADWFLDEAHKRVLALRGIAPKRPAAAADAKIEANTARKPPTAAIPKSIGDIPGGGDDSDTGGGEFAAIDKLTGDAYERALAKMTPEQRNRYLEA